MKKSISLAVLLCLLLYRPLRQLLEQAVKGIGVSP